jgi:WD40 repeat protein
VKAIFFIIFKKFLTFPVSILTWFNFVLGECILTLNGHRDSVNALIMLPSGILASGSKDKTIKIWNVTKSAVLNTLTSHSDSINALTVVNNRYLASGSLDKTIKLWDLTTFVKVKSWTTSRWLSYVSYLAYDKELDVLASGHFNMIGQVFLWDSITIP